MITLFAYSRKGIETARRIGGALGGELRFYTAERLAGEGFLPIPKPSALLYEEAFGASEALVFVSSCGIAVRSVAPFIRSKTTDPAVVAVDETGRFAVALLSGHLGGANALAERIAKALGAVPVITTATDSNGRFSVDSWAKTHGFAISGMDAAKAVSAAVLEGDVPIKSDFPVKCELPAGLRTGEGGTGIYITYRTDEPFERTLRLIPKCVTLGIGCRKGTPAEIIRYAVDKSLAYNGIDIRAVKRVASIDIKKEEAGLLEYCREAGLPLSFYSSEELNAVKGDFTPSGFVKKITGVDNVCERAAMICADELIIRKTAENGVTVAAALEKTEVRFE
ncbi:MAG: cobalt-precorrin 5A hydrolase [Clostridiales bacterium]|nr:cobalt-precorrin 5A hydrolase [Clostridiales bacterium]